MNVARRHGDVVEQSRPGLLVVAVVVVVGDVALVAPEKMDLSPIQGVVAKPFEQAYSGSAASEHNQRPPSGCDCGGDGGGQPVTDAGYEGLGVRVGLDPHRRVRRHGQALPPAA